MLQRLVKGTVVLFALTAPTLAQCTNPWEIMGSYPGIDGTVYAAVAHDPDGAGPLGSVVAIGGTFGLAGSAVARNIALWNPVSEDWSALGSQVDGTVHTMLSLPNGDLVVAGDFLHAGGTTVNRIARWDGLTWHAFGAGMNDHVEAIVRMSNGDIVAAGRFTLAGNQSAIRIARWDGAQWCPLDIGISSLPLCLAALPTGDLVVGGMLNQAGSTLVQNLARWDGSAWTSLGTGTAAMVSAMHVLPNGELLVSGWHLFPVSLPYLARWNGNCAVNYAAMPEGLVEDLAIAANGDLLACGNFPTAGGLSANNIARWNGSTWSTFGTGVTGQANAVVPLGNGELFVAGALTAAGSAKVRAAARWNGATWQSVGAGVDGAVTALTTMPNGDLVVAGPFTNAGGTPAAGIARWSQGSYTALGTGLVGGSVNSLAALPNGDLVAGGYLDFGTFVDCLAFWNGSTWSPAGFPPNSAVSRLAVTASGELVVSGTFAYAPGTTVANLARWNGSAWLPVGSGPGGPVSALLALPNGDIVIGGLFANGSSSVARWNGGAWTQLGDAFHGFPTTLAVRPDGAIVAAGPFHLRNRPDQRFVAIWNGTDWSALGNLGGAPRTLVALPDGDLLIEGARWNGTKWQPVHATMPVPLYAQAATSLANGDVVFGGFRSFDAGATTGSLVRLTTTCPATAHVGNAGCPGSNGSNTLTAETLPWLGSTFRARSSTVATNALVLAVTGFAPAAIPLTSLLPPSAPNCTLHAAPDVVTAVPNTAGSVTTSIMLPNVPALAGTVLHHQLVVLELDASLTFVDNTVSNSLLLTAGAF